MMDGEQITTRQTGIHQNQNKWIAVGVAIFLAILAIIAARAWRENKNRPVAGEKLTPEQAAALSALEDRYRQETMRQQPALTPDQIKALKRLGASAPADARASPSLTQEQRAALERLELMKR